MIWKKVEYTKSEIDRAGQKVLGIDISNEERKECLKIIDNWRAAHAFPTNTFTINLKKNVKDIPGAVVVQRLKRLDTILDKLERFPSMKLSRMQDLGGCRVIVPTNKDVYSVIEKLRNSRIRHIEHNFKDYIETPNPNTGYRGYHIIYRYNSDRKTDYNGLQVEIQVRTQLQHLWATAVETIGLFTDNGLKFNKGSETWLRFFKLTSAVFSIEENLTIVNDVPAERNALYLEWLNAIQELDVFNVLGVIGAATKRIGHINSRKKKGYYLLVLDMVSFPAVLRIEQYNTFETAVNAYNNFENKKKEKRIDGVLVSAQSYENLVTAYPNYFLNVNEFLNTITSIIQKLNDGLEKS